MVVFCFLKNIYVEKKYWHPYIVLYRGTVFEMSCFWGRICVSIVSTKSWHFWSNMRLYICHLSTFKSIIRGPSPIPNLHLHNIQFVCGSDCKIAVKSDPKTLSRLTNFKSTNINTILILDASRHRCYWFSQNGWSKFSTVLCSLVRILAKEQVRW